MLKVLPTKTLTKDVKYSIVTRITIINSYV